MGSFWRVLAILILECAGTLSSIISQGKLKYKTSEDLMSWGEYAGGNLGIFKGKNTTIRKHPYLVSTTYYNYYLCSGAIIDESWVLVLADCIFGIMASDLKVVVAGSQDGSSGKTFDVSDVITHPNYGQTHLDYDYGLLKVNGKFKWSRTVKKAALPRREAKSNTRMIIAGWSQSGYEKTLEEGRMELFSRKKCKKIYKSLNITLTPRMNCIYNKGRTSPCSGDVGFPVTEGKHQISQIFSAIATDGECSSKALPAITADVHAAVDWIKSVTQTEQH